MTQTDNQAQMISAAQLAEQFEDIINNYQTVLDAAEKEKEEALIQVELFKAKTASLKAARDSLAESLRSRQPVQPGLLDRGEAAVDADRELLEKELAAAREEIDSLKAERDGLQEALRQADEHMRSLEAQLKEAEKEADVPAEAPAAVVEPAPQPVPMMAEPVLEPVAEPIQEVQAPQVAAEPAPAEEMIPDFEDQKKMLLQMQEELAKLEEQLRNQKQ